MESYSEKLEKRKAYCKEWRENNKEKTKEYRKKYGSEAKEERNARDREYYRKNRDRIIARKLEYYHKNKIEKSNLEKNQKKPRYCAKDKKTNICADCGYPIKECPWLHKGKEVPGWEAKRVQWSTHVGVYTYSISECPLFIPCGRECNGRGL